MGLEVGQELTLVELVDGLKLVKRNLRLGVTWNWRGTCSVSRRTRCRNSPGVDGTGFPGA